jgi:hypothetical protein
MGLNAIGRGLLSIEDSTLYGRSLVNFRPDYGSTWEGEVLVKNSRWVPSCGEACTPHLVGARNDGTHDFGYACSMPREVRIDGLEVDDRNHPDGYTGLHLLADPDGGDNGLPAERPFPYAPCEKITVRGLTTVSGMKPRVSPSAALSQSVAIDADS